ncbi:laccase 12 [Actinidia rufa]|uniref:Laccase 12 n=1 Tax=Actinidia rufa TaxID=165716 RepID=A0A7J0EAI7_9ERIC|nr:laccase 12 [Actinidia rufa]
MYPGPTLEVNDGDSLVIHVVNRARYNVTIHWHGIRQMRTGWADGPEFVTQCPIRPGGSYTYRFTIEGQEGTLWWHAHSSWLRATVYGALIIQPKKGSSYPFPKPNRQTPLLLGEWWDANPIDVVREATRNWGNPQCVRRIYHQWPAWGFLQLFRQSSSSPWPTTSSRWSEPTPPTSNPSPPPSSCWAPAKPPTSSLPPTNLPPGTTSPPVPTPAPKARPSTNTTTTAVLEYKTVSCPAKCATKPVPAALPAFNDTATATAFTTSLRSPKKAEVPTDIDESLFITVGLGLNKCPKGVRKRNCQGPNGTRFAASMNNVSFVLPSNFSILQAHKQRIPGVFTADFPDEAAGEVRLHREREQGVVAADSRDEENHPIHLHGYDFFIVAEGFGNFNPKTDSKKFNLVDPPMRNTASVPVGGWTVIRFVADNPGVWLMHCHLDVHITWGLAMAFLVENGVGELQSLQPPPADLPLC